MDITTLEIVFITVIRVNGREAVRLEYLETFYWILKLLIRSTIQEATALDVFHFRQYVVIEACIY